MSFTTNTSNITGKSTTNAFNVNATTLYVDTDALIRHDLVVEGDVTLKNASVQNANVTNLVAQNISVTNFTANPPVPISSGGTGLSTLGLPYQVLAVNPAGTALSYQSNTIQNPLTITGNNFTGPPTISMGLEAVNPSRARGYIRTNAEARGLRIGTATANIIDINESTLISTFRLENQTSNFYYNSFGPSGSGVFSAISNGGAITFTNTGTGVISLASLGGSMTLGATDVQLVSPAGSFKLDSSIVRMETPAGKITLDNESIQLDLNNGGDIYLGNTVDITTNGDTFNLTTGTGTMNIFTAAGLMNITTGTGQLNMGATAGQVNITSNLVPGPFIPEAIRIRAEFGNIGLSTGGGIVTIQAGVGQVTIGSNLGIVNVYGTAATLAAAIIYIGTAITVPPIPSNLVFACGTITGATGAWALACGAIELTTAQFRINSPLNQIELNGDGVKVTETVEIDSAATPLIMDITGTGSVAQVLRCYQANIAEGQLNFLFGKTGDTNLAANIKYQNSDTLPTTNYLGFGFYNNDDLYKIFVGGSHIWKSPVKELMVLSASGTLTVPGNIISNQNINWGLVDVNQSIVLTVNSPKQIIITGGPPSLTVTLPDALTLLVGWNYMINCHGTNPVTILKHNGATLMTGLPGQLVNVYLLTNPNSTGTWDYHVADTTPSSPSLIAPVTITSTSSSTTCLSLGNTALSADTVSMLRLTSLSAAQATAPIASFYQVGLPTTAFSYLNFGRETGLAGQLTYTYDSTVANTTVGLGFATGTPQPNNFISATYSGLVTINGQRTTIQGTFLGYTSPLLTVNASTTTAGSIANFLAPVTVDNQVAIGFGTAASTGNMATLGFIPGATAAANAIQLGFFGQGTPLLRLVNDGTISFTGTTTFGTANFTSISATSSGTPLTINSTSDGAVVANLFTPNLVTSGNSSPLLLGKANSANQSTYLSYVYNSTLANSTAQWGMNGSAPNIVLSTNQRTTIQGTYSGYTSPNLAVTSSTTTAGSIANFLAPVTVDNQVAIGFGTAASTSNMATLGFIPGATSAANAIQLGFFGQGLPLLRLVNDGTVSVSGKQSINGTYTGFNSPTLQVNSSSTVSGSIANFLAPVTSASAVSIGLGISVATGNMASLQFQAGSPNQIVLGFYGVVTPEIRLINDGSISISANTTLTGIITIAGATTISSAGTPLTVNSTSDGATVANLFTPNLVTSGNSSALLLGKANSANQSTYLSYVYNSTLANSTAQWGMNGSAPNIILSTNQRTTIQGTYSGYTSPNLAVTSSTTTAGSIANFLAPVTVDNQVAIGFGTAATISNMATLGFIPGATTAANAIQLGFFGQGSPLLRLINNGTASLSGTYSGYGTPLLAIDASTTSAGSIANFFAPVTNGNQVAITVGSTSSRGATLGYIPGASSAQSFKIGFNSALATYPTITLNDFSLSGSPTINMVGLTTIENTTDGGAVARFLSPGLTTPGNAAVLILGKAEANNQGTYMTYDLSTNVTRLGIIGTPAAIRFEPTYIATRCNNIFFENQLGTQAMQFYLNGIGVPASGYTGAASIRVGNIVTYITNAMFAATNVSYIQFNSDTGTARGAISFNGTSMILSTISDYRLKSNVVPLSNSLTLINQLNPCTYDFEENLRGTGFIAHELQEFLPEAVFGIKDAVDEEGNPKFQSISLNSLIPHLTGAIKDLYSLVQTLQDRITILEQQ